MHSVISVNLLRNPPNGRVLDEFVAFPLQADCFLCFGPTVWIHPITGDKKKNFHLKEDLLEKTNKQKNIQVTRILGN